MAKVNEPAMKQWLDGETIHAAEYNSERTLIVRALNDTDRRVDDITTDMRAPFSVNTGMIADGAVTPTKIVKETVTQYAYDKNEVEQRIADALTGGLPQSVIDSIVAGATQSVTNHATDQKIHVTEIKQAKWDNMLPKAGGEVSGTVTMTNSHPVVSRVPGTKGWVHYNSAGNGYFISPERVSESWDWDYTSGIGILPMDLQWGGGRKLSTSQHHKLTQDNGLSINISNSNLNNLLTAGNYVGENMANAPSAQWHYIRVQVMSAGFWIKQEAINLFTNTYQMRTGSEAGGVLSWGAWTTDVIKDIADLKQSGVEAHQRITEALNAKGQPAVIGHTFAEYAWLIGQIQTNIPAGEYPVFSSAREVSLDTSNQQNVIMKSVTVGRAGTYRIKFTLYYNSNTNVHTEAAVFINGVQRGITRSSSVPTPVTFVEDFAVNAGDVVDIRMNTYGVNGRGYLNAFQLCLDIPFTNVIGS